MRARSGLVVAFASLVTAIGVHGAIAQTVEPEDAVGCNGAVCIELYGTGLTVDRWRTTALVSGYRCETAYYWRDGGVIRAESVCGHTNLESTWDDPGWFPDGTVLCNTWSDISGKPCKTVKR